MTEVDHMTPLPWQVEDTGDGTANVYGSPVDGDVYGVDYCIDIANARRIVACVNACEGIADPTAVADLLAACEFGLIACQDNIAEWCRKNEPILLAAIEKFRSAIRKATGSQL